MSELYKEILIFVTAFLVSLIATPFVIKFALKLNITDHPNYRKIHKGEMPLLGGLAIFLGFVTPLMFVELNGIKPVVLFGAFLMVLLGFLDDKISLGARLKFLLPSIAALFLVIFGLRTTFLPSFGYDILNILFTFAWIIGVVNIYNYIDNMNGLCAGTGFINVLFFLIILLLPIYTLPIQYEVIFLCLALMGALAGFLPYNFPRAKIFAGDIGSMLTGFVIATISIYGSWEGENIATSLLVPILILSYPLSDAFFVTVLRIKNKKFPWIGDKNHTSHRIHALGFSTTKTVLLLFLINIIFGLLAIRMITLNFTTALHLLLISLALICIIYLLLAKIPFQEQNMEKEFKIVVK